MDLARQAQLDLFGTDRPVIGMVHFPPLPGAALYDRAGGGGLARTHALVQADVEALVAARFDAILFCNGGDRPYPLEAPLEAAAAMSAVIARVTPIAIPFGVDYLCDPICALAVAHATGGSFVRGVFTGTYESDMGLWSPNPSHILRFRSDLAAQGIRLFMNVAPEYAASLGPRPIGVRARSAVVNGLADAILIAGPMAGSEADLAALEQAIQALGRLAPVFVNTGVTAETVGNYLRRFDGVIVGTTLKVEQQTWNPIDPERARAFMQVARAAREALPPAARATRGELAE